MNRYAIVLLASVLLLRADVTTQTFSRMKMVGGMVNSEATTKTFLRPNMKAEDQTLKVTAVFSGKPQHTGVITRLDRELIWELKHDDRTYSESPLTRPTPTGGAQAEVKVEGGTDTVQDYRVVKSEFAVRKLDSTRVINGFSCEGYQATWTLVIEQVKTKEQATSVMELVKWTTALTDVLKQAQAEEESFNQAYAAKLGILVPIDQSRTMGMDYLSTLGMSQKEIAERMQKFAGELEKIKGYPIVIEVKWIALDDSSRQARAEGTGDGSGGVPSVSGLLGRALANKLAPKPSAADRDVVFSAYVEVKSVTLGAVPDAEFEVPKNYRKL